MCQYVVAALLREHNAFKLSLAATIFLKLYLAIGQAAEAM